MKSYTSTKLHKAIQEHPQESRQFWQQHNQPIELNTNDLMQQKLDYIHNNPVVSGFVDNPEEGLFSSARDYAGRKGLLEICFIQ
jgi:putative transposase